MKFIEILKRNKIVSACVVAILDNWLIPLMKKFIEENKSENISKSSKRRKKKKKVLDETNN